MLGDESHARAVEVHRVATIVMRSLQESTRIESPLLRQLHGDLKQDVDREITMTLRVAVLTAGKASRAEVIRTLGITEAEARMALERLSTVAQRWRNETT